MTEQLLVGILCALLISAASYIARFLTAAGAVAQFVLGTVLLGFGGWRWTLPMLVFFLLSSMFSRFGTQRRRGAEEFFAKSSRRDAWQVAANGGVAGLIVIAWLSSGEEALYVAHLGAVAAAAADTWGTEIGTLSRSSPVLISTFKKTEAGTSGAISVTGLAAAIGGAAAVFAAALPWIAPSERSTFAFAVVAGGFFGSLVDSLLGGFLQARFLCPVCERLTERSEHCGSRSSFAGGMRWLRNDAVNFVCTIAGAAGALLIYHHIVI